MTFLQGVHDPSPAVRVLSVRLLWLQDLKALGNRAASRQYDRLLPIWNKVVEILYNNDEV